MIDMMKMMKQAQEIQGRMQQLQEDLAGLEVEGQSGAGLVKVTLNGKFEARGVRIDPSLLKPEEAEMLEDLILAAFQDAKAKAEAAAQAKMAEITGGLNLPAGLKCIWCRSSRERRCGAYMAMCRRAWTNAGRNCRKSARS